MADFAATTIARFWSKVAVTPGNSDCWIWRGSKTPEGYGKIKVRGRSYRAHRVAFFFINGRWPIAGNVVRHKCDNPSCVNPLHLEEGTCADNVNDMVERGRQRNGRLAGSANPRANLTEDQVGVIKRRIADGETNTRIAEDYPVSHQLISRIRTGRSWAHLS